MGYKASEWAWEQSVTPTAKLVLVRLADRADLKHSCFPSVASVARDTGLSERTVRREISRLETDARIVVKRQKHPSGAQTSSKYFLQVPPDSLTGGERHRGRGPLTHRQGDPDSVASHGGDTTTPLEPIKVITKEPSGGLVSESSDAKAVGFAAFWAAYPKPIAKIAAEREFNLALRRAPIAEIMAGLGRYRPDVKYVSAPAQWLRDGRWMDEVRAPAARRPEPLPLRPGSVTREEAVRLGL